MKVAKISIEVHECIKYDGVTHRVELTGCTLDDGQVLSISEIEDVGLSEEIVDFVLAAYKEVDNLGWVYTSNPEVYGYVPDAVEICGRRVNTEDINAFAATSWNNTTESFDFDPGPFVLDLAEPPSFVEANLEPNSHNRDACTVTLYFDGVPEEAQVREVCGKLTLPLGVDLDDPQFAFEEHPTKVSAHAGLRRYEVYPTA